MTTTDEVVYRALRLPSTLRTAMKEAREANDQTNAQFFTQVVDDNLPTLVNQLEQLGFGKVAGRVKPERLPFSDSAGTWASLRDAAEQFQIPATQLLQICLAAAVGETPASAKGRRRRKTSQTKTTARMRSTPKTASRRRKRKTTARWGDRI